MTPGQVLGAVPGGMVRLTPSRGTSLLVVLSGDPDRLGGVGGWESSERQGRRPARWWKDQPEDTITLPCILDLAAPAGESIETRIATLYAMGSKGGYDEPPTILLAGDVQPRDRALTWVLQDIHLGARLKQRGGQGALRRQELTIDLEGYEGLSSIVPVRVKSTRDSRGHRRRRTIRTRSGDTLRAIAVRELGSSGAWTSIRGWNPRKLAHIDPDARLRVGTVLTLR